MYLDTHERDEVQKLVLSFHMRWFICTLRRISNAGERKSILLLLCYLGGLIAALWVLDEPVWVIWVLCGIYIILLQLPHSWHRKEVKKQIEPNTPERWQEEIEQLQVDKEERELFLRLLTTMRTGTKEEAVSVTDEALCAPALSKLAFVRELRAYLHDK